jgi:CheY-like chemotaxis protein
MGQRRVLVVDDVEANRRLVQALLRRFGHVSDVATSGRQAVEMTIAGGYDVVLMDVQLPDIDGMEATRRIRERLGEKSPRIVAITANALPGDRERCLAAGMDDYISKPIQAQALRAAVEQGGATDLPAQRAAPKPESPPAGAIDWSRIDGLAPFDPDGSMVAGAIAAFLADAPARIAAIRAAHAAMDPAAVASAAHALKGSAANIGVVRLLELSRGIEALALDGELENARAPIGDLEHALADARAALAGRGKISP